MIKISEIVSALSSYLDAQRELDRCRQRAQGDVEYYSFSFMQNFKRAEADLERTLNAYIDQRVAQKIEPLKTPVLFEASAPAARPVVLAA